MTKLQALLQKADLYKEQIVQIYPVSDEIIKFLDHYFCIDFTYNSNALEGNVLTLAETKAALQYSAPIDSYPSKDCQETVGFAAAYDFMLELARKQNISITDKIIRTLHYLSYQKINAEQGGQYRTIQVDSSASEYVPPAPEDVAHLMSHLADQIHSSRTTLHPVELAAMAHKRLIDIHPFNIGNHKIASLLMNLLLVNHGYCVVSIPADQKNEYRHALTRSRKQNDIEPFAEFIAQCVIDAEIKFIEMKGKNSEELLEYGFME